MDQEVNQIEGLLAPITNEMPTGELAVYEPEYGLIKKQIDILSAPDPSDISWPKVLKHSASLLQEKSKDLTIASYYVVAKFEVDRIQGLAHGIELLAGMLERYWEKLFPELRRKRGRINALNWMLEKLEPRLKNVHVVVADKESLQAILESTKKITEILQEKLEGEAPQFAKVDRLVSSLISGLPKPATVLPAETESKGGGPEKNSISPQLQSDTQFAAATEEAQPDLTNSDSAISKVADTIAGKMAPISKPASDSDVLDIMRGVQKNLLNIASHLQSTSLKDHRAYQLSRMAAWLLVNESPAHRGDGITPFSAPAKQQLESLDKKLSNNEYERLLRDAEAQFIQNPYWLDAHRYSTLAMEGLGDEYALAKRSVIAELKAFITRFPDMLDLKFKSGVGFAGEDTRRWFQQINSQQAQATVSVVATLGGNSKALQQVTAQATVLAGKGKFKEGLALFQKTLTDVVTERDRFMVHMQQAIYCFNADCLEMAIPQLEYLDAQSQKFSLQAWEPELVAELIHILLLSYVKLLEKKKKTPAELSEPADELFARLCQLNMAAAMEIDSKKWQ